jgi:uncharacterized protein YjiS (DUF1127 family)
MSTSISDNQFSFVLPRQSYIDTSLEEQTTRVVARPARPRGFTEWLAMRIAAFRAWNAERTALSELSLMSDRELMDVGLTRSDFVRMFDDTANQDLKVRGLNA